MANVKVHLKEIIKYVLLLGVVLQSILGAWCIIRWVLNTASLWVGIKALLGVCIGSFFSYAFLRLWCKGKTAGLYLWGSAGIVSTPVVLQTCLDGGWELCRVAVLCGVILGCLALWGHPEQKKRRVLVGILALALVSALCLAGGGAPSLEARLLSRCGFPYLYDDAYNVTLELKEPFELEKLREGTRSADGIYTVFYSSLLERYGDAEVADRICMELAEYCIRKNTRGTVSNLLWDVAGYHFPMLVSELQLRGKGYDAVTGVNYGELMQKAGSLTPVYWDYGVVWYVLSLLLLSGMWKQLRGKKPVAIIMLLLEAVILCLVMQGAGYFDYKNFPVVEFLRMGLLLEGFSRLIMEKDE